MTERTGPIRIRLSEERSEQLVSAVQKFFAEDFDQELSEFQARLLIGFFVRHVGAPVYNQAIQDARGFFQDKLADLDGEFYEPEES